MYTLEKNMLQTSIQTSLTVCRLNYFLHIQFKKKQPKQKGQKIEHC